MPIPSWTYGNGWLHHVDFADVLDVLPVGRCWLKLCEYAEQLRVIRFTTEVPRDLFPGYYTRTEVVRSLAWAHPALGCTPYNAAVWGDPTRSPHYATPTNYVQAPRNADPASWAVTIVHELFHLLMPVGLDQHNPAVGTVFTSPVGPGATVTPLAAERLTSSTAALMRGERVMGGSRVVIPQPLAPDNPVQPPKGWGLPTKGPVTDVATGRVLQPAGPVFR